jgi:CMP-N,N'-diacetyllegionaminic acid synthase|tara:strand:+ start:10291 stop:11208 length:918 start_codon:yes stop_codon:yes gene_type:complete
MNKKVLISGYGSIGRRHAKILSKVVKRKNITIFSKQKIGKFSNISNIKMLNKINPDYIVICNPTADHLNKIKFIEKNCKDKVVLVEKPLFSKPNNIKIKNNKYYVGYNLRFNPLINFLKNRIKGKKIWNVNVFCGSYLPNWRNNIDYKKSASAKIFLGGGVLLDLSHELDYIQWLFGKIKIEYCKSKKFSNLKIETDDFLSLTCKTNKVPSIQVTLNYFTRNPTRQIFIDGHNISLQADLIKRQIVCFENNKKRIYSFNNSNKNLEIKKQHIAVLTKKNSFNLCTYNEGKQILRLIKQIRSRSKI